MTVPHGISDEVLDLEVFLAADGAQIEIRALAECSGDPLMIRFLVEAAKDRKNNLKDFHCLNGNMLTGFPLERIRDDKPLRKAVKNLIFGIVFGKAEAGIYDYIVQKMREADGPNADLTGVTKAGSIAMHRKFFQVYAGVARWIKKVRAQADTLGYVESIFGFRRWTPKEDATRGTYWGNQALNSPVQSSAHGFVLIALALLDLKPRTYNLLQKCVAEVHDALFFRVRLRDLPAAHAQLMHLLEVGASAYAESAWRMKLRVPILAEAEAGFSMGSMVEYTGGPIAEFLAEWRKKQAKVDAMKWEELMPTSTAV